MILEFWGKKDTVIQYQMLLKLLCSHLELGKVKGYFVLIEAKNTQTTDCAKYCWQPWRLAESFMNSSHSPACYRWDFDLALAHYAVYTFSETFSLLNICLNVLWIPFISYDLHSVSIIFLSTFCFKSVLYSY